MNRLTEIFALRKQDVAHLKQVCPLADMASRAAEAPPPLDFIAALTRTGIDRMQGPALIAEIKRASPSRGDLAPHLDPVDTARRYRDCGASAISVLTESRYFKGSLDDLRQVASARLGLPLLRKDFIFEPWQVYEARQAGADAILLIVAGLAAEQLRDLHGLIRSLKMAALVEVHNEAELGIALACEPALVGINNRDLTTFDVRLDTTIRLRPLIPPSIVVVAESGIRAGEDRQIMQSAGVDALLVGEALVTSPDIQEGVRRLAGR